MSTPRPAQGTCLLAADLGGTKTDLGVYALDAGPPKASAKDYMRNETRFRMVEKQDPERFKRFLAQAEREAASRYSVYSQLAGITVPQPEGEA